MYDTKDLVWLKSTASNISCQGTQGTECPDNRYLWSTFRSVQFLSPHKAMLRM